MIECASFEELLDDYVDGLLDRETRTRVEAHAAACAGCARLLEAQRELLRATAGLPREIPPSRDLLPGIRRAVHRASGSSRRSPAYGQPWWIGLAAALLIAAGLMLVYGLSRPTSVGIASEDSTPPIARPASLPADFRQLELEYERATEELLAAIDERSDRLSPETVTTLRNNLAIIDEAIDEIRAALETDPGDAASTEILATMYQQKIHLLWRVSRLSS